MGRFCLLAVSLAVLAVASTYAGEGSLCGQEPPNQCKSCLYLSTGNQSSAILFKLLRKFNKTRVQEIFSLQEPNKLTSVDEFFKELVVYKSILFYLKTSMECYMATPEYREKKVVKEEGQRTKTYFKTLSATIDQLEQIISDLANKTSKKHGEDNSRISGMELLQDSTEIYVYTYRVAKKLNDVLQAMLKSQCLSNKDGGDNSAEKSKEDARGEDKSNVNGEDQYDAVGRVKNNAKGKGKNNAKGGLKNNAKGGLKNNAKGGFENNAKGGFENKAVGEDNAKALGEDTNNAKGVGKDKRKGKGKGKGRGKGKGKGKGKKNKNKNRDGKN